MAMGSLSRDSALNAAAREFGRALIGWLVGWLVKTWPKRWPPGSELERLHLSGLTQRKGFRGLGRWECYGGSSFKTFGEIPETYLSPPVQSMCEGSPQNP